MFRGTFTAVVTPFRNGDVDFAAFEKLAEAQIAAGITGVIAVGTTGESPTLTHDEKHEVIERAIKIANGRCKVIAGAGTNSTRDSIEATKFAEKAGADGALLVAPYYNKPSQEGLFRHFKAIAGATSLPVMLYNIPGRIAPPFSARVHDFERRRFVDPAIHGGGRGWGCECGFEFVSGGTLCTGSRLRFGRLQIGRKFASQTVPAV
jgi:4-hydroxy-tetrahydrodipicolinate synthase